MTRAMLGLPLLLLALAGCGGRPSEVHTGAGTPAPVVEEEEEVAPTATPTPTQQPDLTYDEIRNVAIYNSVPSTVVEGYFTVSQDGKWGLIRGDGTEVLPCLAEAPVFHCGTRGHWVWNAQISWEELNAYSAALKEAGEPEICGGHGVETVNFVYDLDAPGRDIYGFDPSAMRAYWLSENGGRLEEVTDELWATFGDLLPTYIVYESNPSQPKVYEYEDGTKRLCSYAYRDSMWWSADIQLGGYFFDEPLAPVQKMDGTWTYLNRDMEVCGALYEPTYDSARDPQTGAYTAEPKYPAPMMNGYVAVCRNGRWGLLGPDGAEVIPCEKDGVAWDGTNLLIKEGDGWYCTELPA